MEAKEGTQRGGVPAGGGAAPGRSGRDGQSARPEKPRGQGGDGRGGRGGEGGRTESGKAAGGRADGGAKDKPKDKPKEKDSKKPGGGGGAAGDLKQEDQQKPWQGVVLADSFLDPPRFRPLTLEVPKVLMPLANVPMLEYALELLARNGITDIIIFATAHADLLADYMRQTRWFQRVNARVVMSKDCLTAGDALRHLHDSALLWGDFVLLSGDVVANIDLRPALAEHVARALPEHSPQAMTLVLRRAAPADAVRDMEDDTVVVVDARSDEVLHYSNDVDADAVELPRDLIAGRRAVRVRHDLVDTYIAICSKKVG